MKNRVYLSFDSSSAPWLDEIVAQTEGLGLGISGRHVPVGGATELIPDLVQQLRASVAAVVVVGAEGPDETVENEIDWSEYFDVGIVAVMVSSNADVPPQLYESGAEILNWTEPADRDRFGQAITAAHRAADLMERARRAGTGAGAQCARPTRPKL